MVNYFRQKKFSYEYNINIYVCVPNNCELVKELYKIEVVLEEEGNDM